MAEPMGTRPMPAAYGSNGAGAGTATPAAPHAPTTANGQSGQYQEPPKPQVKKKSIGDTHLDELLDYIINANGSDLHIAPGIPPIIRSNGGLEPTPYENCSPMDVQQMMYAILTDEQIQRFETNWELDFSYALQQKARFRVNLFKDKGSVAAALRLIPTKIPTMEELGLPAIFETLTHVKRGLILVTGPTGSGKSTTLASMINHINLNRSEHIITIEDPIEYLHNHRQSVINQRELGMDTKSFANALRASLREDPDVLLVGEMRDQETMMLAVSAAETGHLVFATLHTNSAATSVDRIVDSFPEGGKEQVRLQLSNNIQAIISQQLIPTSESYKASTGKGRIAVQEIMIATPAVRNLIREAKAHQLTSIIQTSAKVGMITTDQALRDTYNKGMITYDMAISRAQNTEELKGMMAGSAAPGANGMASGGPRPGAR